MKRLFIFITLALFLMSSQSHAQLKHAADTLYPTYTGRIMAGYQGWFRLPKEGVFFSDETKVRIDQWPDVSEYEKTYPTGLKLPDGSPARFFNSADESTVNLHFKWMREYGLDGVFMQRFWGATRPQARNENAPEIQVLTHAFKAASENRRAIAIMYDLSGVKATGEDTLRIIDDWKYLVDTLKVTNQSGVKTYLHHKNKPLVAIWGIGFPDRPYNIRNIALEKLLDFFHNDPEYGGCAVMLGVPNYWRTLNADTNPDPYLHEIIKKADLIMPWSVQRFTPLLHNEMDRYRDQIKADTEWCKANNIDYVPCVTPGFSWHNLSRHAFPDDVKPIGSIPRQAGRFYWQQLSTAIAAGAGQIYIAMFDEVNEGTAIFKVSNTPPAAPTARFINNDDQPSDLYLFLTGQAAAMLRKEKQLSTQIPTR